MADSPLQKAPYALLGAFDLKTQGFNPTRFGELVRPVVEAIDFYLQQNLRIPAITSATVEDPDDAVSYTVPATETWRLLGIGLAVFTDAADTAIAPYGRFDVRYGAGGSTVTYLGEARGIARGTTYRNSINALLLPVPLLCGPGTVIAYRSETQYTAPATAVINVQYQLIQQ